MEHYLSYLRNTARTYWDQPAISDYKGVTYTHCQLFAKVLSLRMAFSDLGIQEGDRISICGKNSTGWAIAFLAAASYRAVSVPILNGFTPKDIQGLVNHSESLVLFTEKGIWNKLDVSGMPQLRAVIALEDFSLLYAASEDFRLLYAGLDARFLDAHPLPLRPEEADYEGGPMEDLTIINYTSGTTGNPKGVMISNRNISSNLDFDLNEFPVRRGDKALIMLPLAHMYGLTVEFLYTICGGAHVTFLGRTPTPSLLMQALRDIRPFIIITVPLVIEKIVKGRILPQLRKPAARVISRIPLLRRLVYDKVHDGFMKAFGGKVRYISIGGAALSPLVEDILLKARIPFSVGYGMTECAPLVAYVPASGFKSGSCGKPILRTEIRVDSSDPQHQTGELQIRGDNVMMGYYRNPEATREAFTQDGWLRTGDLGLIDNQGNVYIKGRLKCMILTSNGQNIYPEEIEDKLNGMDGVQESLVVSRGGCLVALLSLEGAEDMDQGALEARSLGIVQAVNRELPAYSRIAKAEVLREGFQHTPKNSIKRTLYT